MERIGLIGLGLLGGAIAERLLAAGYTATGYDLNRQRCDEFVTAGGTLKSSAAEVAQDCETLLLSLPDSRAVKRVIESMQHVLHAGQRIIDTSTGEPQDTVAVSTLLAKQDVHYLDATILGSSLQLRDRQVVIMVGGSSTTFEASAPLLHCLAEKVFHVGPSGSGARMKLVVNLVLGLNRAVLAEGLTLAQSLELDLPLTLEILKSGAAYSTVMDVKGEKMLTGDFAPQARLSQHLKDVRLMLGAAAQTGISLPLSEVHRSLLQQAEAAGWGESDNSAILRAYDRKES